MALNIKKLETVNHPEPTFPKASLKMSPSVSEDSSKAKQRPCYRLLKNSKKELLEESPSKKLHHLAPWRLIF